MATSEDAVVRELRRPFPPESVKFKIQTNPKGPQGKAMVVAFIDARNVGSRLNKVVGSEWESKFSPMQAGSGLVCHLTVLGKTRCDVGWTRDWGTDMGVKTAYSDALKRAAVQFGVGEFLYSLPRMWVDAKDLKSWQGKGGTQWAMTPATEARLRNQYQQWCARDDVAKEFGKPLGWDSLDHQGDVETLDAQPVIPDEAPAAGPKSPTNNEAQFFDYVRAAIRGKDGRKLKDDVKWAERILALAPDEYPKFREGLLSMYAELGGDTQALEQQFAQRAA